jgi:hypothetical protein
MQAANDFFNDPSSKPNPGCLSQIGKPAFKTEKSCKLQSRLK